MRALTTVATATLVAVAAATSAGAAAASCAPAAAKALARTGAAQIYSAGGYVYGCLGARTTLLGAGPRLGPGLRVARFALSARYAGVARVVSGIDSSSAAVALVDLRSGATLARAQATTPENRPESFIGVSAIAIDARGTLAWIGSRAAVGAFTPIYEVHALSTAGAARLLASATDIAPHSLTLQRNTLRWRQSRRTRAIRLTP